ncbi:MAG: ribosome biogenesis GTP-binding protein YihA/YsxC [Bacilli bacterium]|nr:ribosome biogenesis GTP-binding protein YihA/YsxC [Bacilli bacterium]
MINFKNSTFIKSLTDVKEKPSGNLPEVLIVGKSNVGKSSLINALTGRNRLAFTSSKPGHTKLLNYYLIDNRFYLVDAPGYGFAKGGVDLDRLFGEMMENYFVDNNELKLVLLLIDSRREFNQNDIEILEYVKENHIPYMIVITKTDKVNQSEKAKLQKHLTELAIEKELVYLTSALETRSLDKLKSAIEKAL